MSIARGISMNEIQILVETLYNICFNDPKFKDEHACHEYYVNCVVDKNGKWEDNKLFECIKKAEDI
jgi:hypothetical protein